MKLTWNSDKMMTVALALFAAYATMLLPSDAMALGVTISGTGGGTGNPIGDTLCTVANWFTGPIGSGIATLAILVIGVGALMGKVSWGMAIIVGVGVGVIFGAPQIVNMLNGEGCS